MAVDSHPFGLLLVLACVGVALGGLALARRLLHREDLEDVKDVASYLFAVVGTLYAVILGLVVVDAMTRFYEARMAVEEESNALSDILLLASQLPGDGPRRVRDRAAEYIRVVIEEEWPHMAGRGPLLKARMQAVELVREIYAFEPRDDRESQLFASAVEAANDFWNSRRARMMLAVESGLPALVWVALIAGGAITVVFTYFFKVGRYGLQVAMTAMLSTVIALNLYLILMFASPFSGSIQVSPQGFELSRFILKEVPPR
ncbi:MAG: hypothetical protein BGO49_03480 [Planctomycetales bacterium 71-10]|nr:MAG: hypothetical protein BGO49_03480 [Planctomycetales bacterium 71-10]